MWRPFGYSRNPANIWLQSLCQSLIRRIHFGLIVFQSFQFSSCCRLHISPPPSPQATLLFAQFYPNHLSFLKAFSIILLIIPPWHHRVPEVNRGSLLGAILLTYFSLCTLGTGFSLQSSFPSLPPSFLLSSNLVYSFSWALFATHDFYNAHAIHQR